MKLYDHQIQMSNYWQEKKRCINLSEAGTGKTLAMLDAFSRSTLPNKKLLVIAPLSILKSAWLDDSLKYKSDLNAFVPEGTQKQKLSQIAKQYHDYNIFIINHDFVKFMKQHNFICNDKFTHLVVDEFTAYKNCMSKRSLALFEIAYKIPYICVLSATPFNTTIEDMFYPIGLVDTGQRLGLNLPRFRAKYRYCPPAPYTYYEDNPDAKNKIFECINDIVIKYKLDECVDIPLQSVRTVYTNIDIKTAHVLRELRNNFKANGGDKSILKSTKARRVDVEITQPAVYITKILQTLSGAVYDKDRNIVKISDSRYELITELVEERKGTSVVIVYQWKHQLKLISEALEAKRIDYLALDNSQFTRDDTVKLFQRGTVEVLLLQAQSACHGLTLTRAKTLIWSAPTYNYEIYKQMNARIRRISQTEKTTVIHIVARRSKEVDIYELLKNRITINDATLDSLCD